MTVSKTRWARSISLLYGVTISQLVSVINLLHHRLITVELQDKQWTLDIKLPR